MTTAKKNPLEQKAKLVAQLETIQKKIESVDEVRANKIAQLSKRFRLVDLSDGILEKEFKTIRDKYKDSCALMGNVLDDDKKKS